MRMLEGIVIVFHLIVLIRLTWFSRGLNLWNMTLAGAAGLLTLVQLVVEGYRWQMIPAYSALLFILLLLIIRPRQTKVSSTWQMRAVKGVFLLIYAALTTIPPMITPIFSFNKPTGPYEIGTTTYHFVDTDRTETYTDHPQDKRELAVQLWYPIQPGSSEPKAAYIPHPQQLAAGLSTTMPFPAFVFEHLGLVLTNSRQDALVSKQQDSWPVLIFSHGMNLFRNQNTFQMEELASNGYIVAAIDHTYDAAATVLSDGRVAPALTQLDDGLPALDEHIPLWIADVKFVLDQLEELNTSSTSLFYGAIDRSKIGMLGHSFGGATAMQMLIQDDRIKAALNMDGGLYGPTAPETGLGKPFLLINAADTERSYADASSKGANLSIDSAEWMLATLDQRRKHALAGGGYSLTIPGTNHMSVTDFELYSPLLQAGHASIKDVRSLINEISLLFFDRYVKGDQSISLDQIATHYPALGFQQH